MAPRISGGAAGIVLHPVLLPCPAAIGDGLGKPVAHGRRLARKAVVAQAAQGALRSVLQWHLGRAVTAEELRRDEHGKASLASGELHFNLSHSGAWLYIVVADSEVGVDIERRRRLRSRHAFSSFTDALCMPGESIGYGTGESALRRCWTRAEAVFKCLGMGMSVPLDGLRLPQGALTAATRVDTGYGAVWIADLPGAAEQSACVASRRAFDSIEVVCSAPVRALLSHRPGALTVSWVDQAPAGHQIMQPCR
ncbi:4'-phosphopantetheinyl transferase family protein [Collimonas humicola]|uniref:4'-phosphopantetheinyl transferase family protein n=1 Tax=Collimonas humicola TaxID=2825886 RepID=UPI001B8D5C35|nr:4'-phosphopantetheinyl transferase superfamily protein [Collimonas humicola]